METPLDEQHLLAKVRDYLALLDMDQASESFIPLAQCYLALGLTDAALDAVKRGVIQNPDHIAGLLLFAKLLSKNGDHDDAIAAYERVLNYDPDSERALIGLAELDVQQLHYDRAKGRLNQIRKIYPHSTDIEALEEQLESLCNGNDGDNDDDGTVESIPLATATMAELYLKQGLKEKAICVYQRLLQQQPDSELFRSKLADLSGSSVDCTDSLMMEGLERWLVAIDRRRKHV